MYRFSRGLISRACTRGVIVLIKASVDESITAVGHKVDHEEDIEPSLNNANAIKSNKIHRGLPSR